MSGDAPSQTYLKRRGKALNFDYHTSKKVTSLVTSQVIT